MLEDLHFWVCRWQSSVFLPKGEDGVQAILLTNTHTPQEEETGMKGRLQRKPNSKGRLQ